MRLRFIGSDGSLGLKHGETYNVKIYSNSIYIWVEMLGVFTDWRCAYSSPQTLAENWEKPE